MTVVDDSLSRREMGMLGHIHVEALPESVVSLVGERYARAFYRYVASSQDELVFVKRGGTDGAEILGACIVSLQPKTLSRRLLFRTPLLMMALFALGRFPLGGILKNALMRLKVPMRAQPHCPEIILIFTVATARSQGLGTRLLACSEAWLVAHGFDRLIVKTRDDPANRAISFYERSKFVRIASLSKNGKPLVLFEKLLRLDDNISASPTCGDVL